MGETPAFMGETRGEGEGRRRRDGKRKEKRMQEWGGGRRNGEKRAREESRRNGEGEGGKGEEARKREDKERDEGRRRRGRRRNGTRKGEEKNAQYLIRIDDKTQPPHTHTTQKHKNAQHQDRTDFFRLRRAGPCSTSRDTAK